MRRGWLAGLLTVAVACLVPAALAAESGTPLEQAAAMRGAGRLDEALDLLRAESRAIKEADGDDSPRLLPVNDLAASILIDKGSRDGDKGSLDNAKKLLEKTIATRRRLVDAGGGDHAIGLCRSHLELARLQRVDQQVLDALATARQGLVVADAAAVPRIEWLAAGRTAIESAVAAAADLVGAHHELTRAAREQAAATFIALGMFDEAIEQRRQLLASLEACGDSARKDVPAATARLCRLMIIAGRADAAITLLEDTSPGGGSAGVETMRLLGEAQLAAGRFTAADESFERVLAATGAATNKPTAATAADWLRSVLVAVRRGTPERLPAWFDQLVKDFKPGMPGGAMPVDALATLGDVQAAGGRPAEAAVAYAEAMRLASSTKPSAPERIAHLAGRLAAARLQSGSAAAARAVAEPALAAAELALGPGDGAVGLLRLVTADALCRGGDAAGAAAMAEAALRRGPARPDDSTEEYLTTVIDRIAVATGDSSWPERFAAARIGQFGRNHPHVGSAWSLAGAARLTAGDGETARKYLANAVAVQRAGLGDDHPDVAASLILLARAEQMSGDAAAASATASKALATWERIAGPKHPGTLAAAEVLVSSRLGARDTTGVVELLRRLSDADVTVECVRRAEHLVTLAGVLATDDRAGAEACLKTVIGLPCWENGANLSETELERLAAAAARAAFILRATGNTALGEDVLRRARATAYRMQEPRQRELLLERIARLAADGEPPFATP